MSEVKRKVISEFISTRQMPNSAIVESRIEDTEYRDQVANSSDGTTSGVTDRTEESRGSRRAHSNSDFVSFGALTVTRGPIQSDKKSDSQGKAVSREARASQDELSAVLEQLAGSARILTAISLQNGLVDGTISPDAVTAELLNIGAAELELLKAFDRSKVDGFIEKLKIIGPSLAGDAKTLTIENVIVLMNEWRLRIEDIGDVKDTSSIDSYLKAVRNTKSFDQTLIDDIERAAIKAEIRLEEIPTLDQETSHNIWIELRTLKWALRDLAGAPETLANLTKNLQKKKLVAEEKSISTTPQVKFVDFLYEFFLRRGEITQNPPGDYDKLVQVFSSVFSLVSDAKASEGEMRVMGAVSDSRRPPQDRNITRGFLNGLSDLANLPSDADNEKFKELTAGFDTDVLKTGLKPLESPMMKAADVDIKWWRLSSDSIRATKDFREISEMLITSGTPPEKATLLMLDKCNKKPNSLSDFYDGINALVKNSTALPNQIDSMADLSEELSESLRSRAADLLKVKDAIKFSSDDANKQIKESKAVLAKLKKQSTTEVLAYLGEVTPKLTALRKGMKDVSSLIQNFPDAKKSVAALLAAPEMKEFEKFFACMSKLSSQFASASSTVALTRKIRKFVNTPTLADNVIKVSSTIDKSRNAVGTLQKECAAMKGNKDEAVKRVMQLEALGQEAKNFGSAVTSLNNVWKVLEKMPQFERFLKDGDEVISVIAKVQDPKTRRESRMMWGDFRKTKVEVREFLADLQAKRDKMVVPKATRFADYGPVFSGFNGMVDADLHVANRLSVIKSLIPTHPELGSPKILLEEFAELDLQFSRFNSHFSGMAASLANVDRFFATFISHPQNASVTTDSELPVGTIAIIAAIVAAVLIVFVLAFVCRKKLKKNISHPKKPNSSNKNKDQKAQIHPIPSGFEANTKVTTTGMTTTSTSGTVPTISTTAPITEDSKTKGVEKDGDDRLHKSTVANSRIDSESASSFDRHRTNTAALVQNVLCSLAVIRKVITKKVEEDTRDPYRQHPTVVIRKLSSGRFVSIESFFQMILDNTRQVEPGSPGAHDSLRPLHCRFAVDDSQLCFTSRDEWHDAEDDWITGNVHQIKAI